MNTMMPASSHGGARGWRVLRTALILATVLVLAACGASPKKSGGGGYYKDDGPHDSPPSNLDAIPDAVPRIEPLSAGTMRPYVIFGKRYVPDTTDRPYKARGRASWYGRKFHGNSTSNGEKYDMYAMTAAHTTLPIPSYVRVTRVGTNKTVVLRVNDRGPFHDGRIIDLSYVAAHKLGIIGPGSGEVIVERILPDEIREIQAGRAAANPGAQAVAYEPAPAPQAQPLPPPVAAIPASSAPTQAAVGEPDTGARGVFLQLGAFGEAGNAHALAGRVGTAFSPGETPAINVHQSGAFYRVRIGPYADRMSAERAAQDVANRTGVIPSLAIVP
ncbi:Rare lipoprotein A precursor [plant metagenome]|uniref:Rare lipoprotein A n=1 Tax=plant metagenome TaxID=1297885 RepID=A0A484SJR1_9ZZZZ